MDIAPGGAVPTCKRGHLRTPENVDSQSHCKACAYLWNSSPQHRAYKAAHYAAHREEIAAQKVARYRALTGPQYNRLLLRMRRGKALRRMADRHDRKEPS